MKKIFITVLIVLSGFFLMLYLNVLYAKYQDKKFFKKAINSKIIEIENYHNKVTYFYYDKKNMLDNISLGENLLIGDSISKEKETFSFKVYRISDSGYKLYKIFNLR
ncbi:MAG: hypothetical protein QM725_11800 [Lacibacter sp.]